MRDVIRVIACLCQQLFLSLFIEIPVSELCAIEFDGGVGVVGGGLERDAAAAAATAAAAAPASSGRGRGRGRGRRRGRRIPPQYGATVLEILILTLSGTVAVLLVGKSSLHFRFEEADEDEDEDDDVDGDEVEIGVKVLWLLMPGFPWLHTRLEQHVRFGEGCA